MFISILITTYNCAGYLREAIKSVLNQTRKDFEIIIVDDGSTDETGKVASLFNNEKIKYYKTEHKGRSKALNYGLTLCKSDWIAILDADDIWHPLKLEKQIPLISNPKTIILSDSVYFEGDKIKYCIDSPPSKEKLLEIFSLHGHICNSSVLYNKNEIMKYGMYNETLDNLEDYELWLRIMHDFTFNVVNEYLVYVRLRKGSLSRDNITSKRALHYKLVEPYYNDLNKSFGIGAIKKQNQIKGWREFLWGDKNKTRNIWGEDKIIFSSPRIMIAYLLTFLPYLMLLKVIEFKLIPRMHYLFGKTFKEKYLLRQNLIARLEERK